MVVRRTAGQPELSSNLGEIKEMGSASPVSQEPHLHIKGAPNKHKPEITAGHSTHQAKESAMSYKMLLNRFSRTVSVMDLRIDVVEERRRKAERYSRRNKTCGRVAVFV